MIAPDALSRRGVFVAVVLFGGVVFGGVVFDDAVTFDVVPPQGSESPTSTDQYNVTFRETAAACGLTYETAGNATGSGDGAVAVADYNRDGYPDVLALGGQPRLFRNTGSDGEGGFEPSGALPSRAYPAIKTGLFFDADGDGWVDLLLIPRTGEPVVLENDGGTYRETDRGFDTALQWGTGAAAADYDRDGDLDVVVVQNGDWRTATPSRDSSGEATDGYPNYLFENTADGFERANVSGVAGSRWSLATSFVDLTGDGYPDVHVANDFGYDALLVNQAGSGFERRRIDGTNRHGMASMVRDVDGDGRLDLFVTNIEFASPRSVWELDSMNVRNVGNNLLLNRGGGRFADRASAYGIRRGGWGWAGTIVDFDNDGSLDALHATKYYLEQTGNGGFETVTTRPSLWVGTRNGTFAARNASAAGLVPSNGRGLATLDFDRDGDRDVVVADTSDRFKLYETVDTGGNWFETRVRGTDGLAIGARVTVNTTAGPVVRVQHSRTNFFAQSTRTIHVGLGAATIERVHVRWPDGTERTFTDVETSQRVVFHRNGSVDAAHSAAVDC